MEYGICNISIIAVRFEPSEKSEMVTQIVFGELYQLLERSNDWIKIKLSYDNYEGWISLNQFFPVEASTFTALNNFPTPTTAELFSLLSDKTNNGSFYIPAGSSLPPIRDKAFSIEENHYTVDGKISAVDSKISRDEIMEVSMLYLNTPYLWGGRGPFGIDCSGFTQMVFKINGIKILRDASQQSTQGNVVNFISEAQAGDLAFFDNEEEEIVHVGIILKNNKIIHASGKVRIDNIDHYGIFNKNCDNYTHKLRLIKNYIY